MKFIAFKAISMLKITENKISKIFRNRLFGVYENIFYFSKEFKYEYLQ